AERVITELAVGEALVSMLDEQGVPEPVERAWIDPPKSQLPPLSEAERRALVTGSVLYGHYETAVDRESAYEELPKRAETRATPAGATPAEDTSKSGFNIGGTLEAFAKSAMRAAGSQVGRQVMRGIFESMLGSPAPRRQRR